MAKNTVGQDEKNPSNFYLSLNYGPADIDRVLVVCAAHISQFVP